MNQGYHRVSIDEIRPGIFIGDVFNESGRLLFSADTLVEGYHQIESMRRQGVSYVFAADKKELLHSELVQNKASDKEDESLVKTYREQIAAIEELKKKTIDIVKKLMVSAKAGSHSTIVGVIRSLEFSILNALENFDLFMALKVVKENERLYNHSVNVAVLMAALAESIGYSKEQVLDIAIGGLLHDIGKLRLPSGILKKGTMYTRQELEIFRRHPKLGVELVNRVIKDVSALNLSIIAQHHERINGTGYPDQLQSDQILEASIICSLADMYDTLTSDGFIKKALLPQEALAQIFQGADDEYPRLLVEHFTKLLGIYPVGSFVKLESGEMGVVTKINRKSLLTPQVMLFFDMSGQRVKKPMIRDLSQLSIQGEDNSLHRITSSLNPSLFNFSTVESTTAVETFF